MKICMVAHLNDLSGANRSLLDLSTKLKELGQSVFVIIPRKGELENALIENKIDYKVIYSGSWGAVKNKEGNLKKYYKKLCNKIAEYRLYATIVKKDFDIVHYNSIIYGVGARLLMKNNIPYVWHLRENFKELDIEFYNKNRSFEIIGNAKSVFVVSNTTYKFYSKILDENKIKVIYNGLALKDEEQIQRSFRNSDKIEILIVGAIYKTKGQLEAIKAIEYVYEKGYQNIYLNIVGAIIDNEYMSEINNYIKEKSLTKIVKLHGYQKNIDTLRKRCDIALICSESEAFGRVTVEAMYYKQLVIGSNIGGTLEIINNGMNGFLYNQGDYLDLAEQIIYALDHRDISEKVIEKAYERALEFTITKTAGHVIDAYKIILNMEG